MQLMGALSLVFGPRLVVVIWNVSYFMVSVSIRFITYDAYTSGCSRQTFFKMHMHYIKSVFHNLENRISTHAETFMRYISCFNVIRLKSCNHQQKQNIEHNC